MNQALLRCLLVGLAGSAGAMTRYLLNIAFGRLEFRFPIGTFFINVTGSFFLGWFLAHRNISDTVRMAVGVGFVGAYTTFSTYMVDSYRLVDDGYRVYGLVNLFGSLAAGLVAVYFGTWIARWT